MVRALRKKSDKGSVEKQRMQAIGDRLSIIRHEMGLTQTQIAERLKISLSAYFTYERGARSIPSTVLIDLAEECQADVHWLITGKTQLEAQHQAEVNKFRDALKEHLVQHEILLSEQRQDEIVERFKSHFLQGRRIANEDMFVLVDLMEG